MQIKERKPGAEDSDPDPVPPALRFRKDISNQNDSNEAEVPPHLRKLNGHQKQVASLANEKLTDKTDPLFFVALNRLDKAEAFKETDRINGRTALNDFILGKQSIQYQKSVRQAEKLKQKKAADKELNGGELSGNKKAVDGSFDPFKQRNPDFDKYIDEKIRYFSDSINSLAAGGIDDPSMVREKSIIHKVMTKNRGQPLHLQNQMSSLQGPIHPHHSGSAQHSQSMSRQLPTHSATGANSPMLSPNKSQKSGKGGGLVDLNMINPVESLASLNQQIQETHIDALQMSLKKGEPLLDDQTVLQQNFSLQQSHFLSPLSLLKEKPTGPAAQMSRIVPIFGTQEAKDRKEASYFETSPSQMSIQVVDDFKKELNANGSTNYLINQHLKQESQRILNHMDNQSVFLSNLTSMKQAQSDLGNACQLGPNHKNFDHQKSVKKNSQSFLLEDHANLPERREEAEIIETIMKFMSPQPEVKIKQPRFQYNIKHGANQFIQKQNEKKHNIFGQVADRMLNDKDNLNDQAIKQNSYGLSKQFLISIGNTPNPNFVALFVPDGSNMGIAKSFKYNLEEIFKMNPVKVKYPSEKPKISRAETMKQQTGKATFIKRQPNQHIEGEEDEICHRAFRKLLEDCSKILNKKKRFETLFMTDGTKINSMSMLQGAFAERVHKPWYESTINLKKTQNSSQNLGSQSNYSQKQKEHPPLVFLLSTTSEFIGLEQDYTYIKNNEGTVQADRERNALEVRGQLNELKSAISNQLYLDWLERNSKTIDPSNRNQALEQQAGLDRLKMNNADYRNRIRASVFEKIRKISPETEHKKFMSPTFGGGLSAANQFLLPDIEVIKSSKSVTKNPSDVNTFAPFQKDPNSTQTGIDRWGKDALNALSVVKKETRIVEEPDLDPYESPQKASIGQIATQPSPFKTVDSSALGNPKLSQSLRKMRAAHQQNKIQTMSKDDMAIKTHVVDQNSIQQWHKNSLQQPSLDQRQRRNTITPLQTYQPSGTIGQPKNSQTTVGQAAAILMQTEQSFVQNDTEHDSKSINNRVSNQDQNKTMMSSIGGENIHHDSSGHYNTRTAGMVGQPQTGLKYDLVQSYGNQFSLETNQVYSAHAEYQALISVVNHPEKILLPTELLKIKDLRDKHPSINERIISAVGIKNVEQATAEQNMNMTAGSFSSGGRESRKHQHSQSHMHVTFPQFLSLKQHVVYFTAKPQEKVQFWFSILNPKFATHLDEADFTDQVEKLVRGGLSKEPTLVSRSIADQFWTRLGQMNALETEQPGSAYQGKLVTQRLQRLIETEMIPTSVFEQFLDNDASYSMDF